MSVPAVRSQPAVRPPVGLLLSIGDTYEKGGRVLPKKLDYFRPKPGQLSQYAAAAAAFAEVYGAEPKRLDDVYFLANEPGQVLEIKLACFGTSGLRGVGTTNYAALPEDEFLARAWSYDDDFLFFPRDVSEVKVEDRESWQGEAVAGRLEGRDDPRIKKLDIRVIASLSFCLPRVMGIGRVAQITTGGFRSIKNLYAGVWAQHDFFRGRLAGPPFRLEVRPARTLRFDPKEKKKVPVDFFELVLDTSLTVQEIYEAMRERTDALGFFAGDGRALTQALALPPPADDEQVDIRDEPEADAPAGDVLNRIARLEQEFGQEALATLRGVFDVESAADLSDEDARKYEAMLTAATGVAPAEDGGEAEVIAEGDDELPDFNPFDAPEGTKP